MRGFLNDGVPKEGDQQWYAAPAIVATNELIGFRMLPNLWEHARAAVSGRREGALTTIASLIGDAGMTYAPFYDRRVAEGVR